MSSSTPQQAYLWPSQFESEAWLHFMPGTTMARWPVARNVLPRCRVQQFHSLHGPDLSGDTWRRTVVAADRDGDLVGCASVTVNAPHPQRFPCATEVAPPYRRRGLGATLLVAARRLRPYDAALSAKIRACDQPAQRFLARVAGSRYQQCLAAVIDPRHRSVQEWSATRPIPGCTDLTELGVAQLVDLFARQYLWVHEAWSPVGDRELSTRIASEEVGACDREVSSVRWVDGRIAAVAFAFPSDDGFEVVAETVEVH
ncbi:MAG: GNAT family N-acetyltransferase [Mycobacterium sp.]|nr:GNAT family N-acetyltransferase [Mycobacterium sp.]